MKPSTLLGLPAGCVKSLSQYSSSTDSGKSRSMLESRTKTDCQRVEQEPWQASTLTLHRALRSGDPWLRHRGRMSFG